MKKHVRVFLGVFVLALVGGYFGLRAQNQDLATQLHDQSDKPAPAAADGGDAP